MSTLKVVAVIVAAIMVMILASSIVVYYTSLTTTSVAETQVQQAQTQQDAAWTMPCSQLLGIISSLNATVQANPYSTFSGDMWAIRAGSLLNYYNTIYGDRILIYESYPAGSYDKTGCIAP